MHVKENIFHQIMVIIHYIIFEQFCNQIMNYSTRKKINLRGDTQTKLEIIVQCTGLQI